MKKIIFWIILFFAIHSFVFAWMEDILVNKTQEVKSKMVIWKQSSLWADVFWIWSDWPDISLWIDDPEDVDIKKHFIKTVQNYILGIVALVTIGMLIYIWYTLASAEWKEDQFKKWIKALIYLIVWLAVLPLSYIIIKIATWFTI